MEIIYGVATTVDGFIAEEDGDAAFLDPFMAPGVDYGFEAFVNGVDALVMGSRTYEKSLELGGTGMGGPKPTWVMSSRALPAADEHVRVTAATPREVVGEMESRGLKRAWLFGGGKLAASFGREGLITEYWLGLIPVVLGRGIRLFDGPTMQQVLTLADSKIHKNGVLQLTYRVRQ